MYFKLDKNKKVIQATLEEFCDLIEGQSGNKILKQDEKRMRSEYERFYWL